MGCRGWRWVVVGGLIAVLGGCPLERGESREATTERALSRGLKQTAGIGGGDDIQAQINADLPPAPSLDVLCSLHFHADTLQSVRMLIGKPQSEETERTNAALSYQFRDNIAIHFTFEWSDGDSNVGEDVKRGVIALFKGYILTNAAIMGQPYPDCWEHKEPE